MRRTRVAGDGEGEKRESEKSRETVEGAGRSVICSSAAYPCPFYARTPAAGRAIWNASVVIDVSVSDHRTAVPVCSRLLPLHGHVELIDGAVRGATV